MKVNDYLESRWKKNREKVIEINEHFDGCRYENSSIPIDECLCDCFNKQVFWLGMEQKSKDFYETN